MNDARPQMSAEQPDAQIVGMLDAEQNDAIRKRQASRARMMGVILLALCALFFAITIVKVGVWG